MNIELFNNPQLQQFISGQDAKSQKVAALLAEASQVMAEGTDATDITVDTDPFDDEEEMDVETIAAVIEASESEFAIFLCEQEKAHSLESPSTRFDMATATEKFHTFKGGAKSRAQKIKNGTKPGSKLVGGASDIANPNAPKVKA